MKENQYTEFKESWHDEYVRYISAFCNTDGGSLYIGINDRGEVVGLQNSEKLIEKLPNFIVQKTGIAFNPFERKEGQRVFRDYSSTFCHAYFCTWTLLYTKW